MGATAEFHRHSRHVDNAHHIGVLLTKHGHSASSLGLVDRHLLHLELMGIGDPAVDQNLNTLQLLGAHSPRAMEVETQTIEVHQRSGLANAWIHHLF